MLAVIVLPLMAWQNLTNGVSDVRTKKIVNVALLVLGLAFSAAAAGADSHGNENVHSRPFKGQVYIMYRDHMSLYTYDKDQPGISNCTDGCTSVWTPALLAADTVMGENYSLIERGDGSFQAAFRGRPLYLYAGDRKPGDINGDGIDGMWRLARP